MRIVIIIIQSEIKNCKMKKIPILGNYNKKSLDCVRRSKMKKRDNNIGKQALKAGWTHAHYRKVFEMSKMCKVIKVVQNVQNCAKCAKLCKMRKIAQNVPHCARFAKLDKM